MDMLAFDAQVKSSMRVNALEKIESAYTGMVAAQGDQKAMKALTKPWLKLLSSSGGKKTSKDFLARFGGGI